MGTATSKMLSKYAIVVLCLLGTCARAGLMETLRGIRERYSLDQRSVAAHYSEYDRTWPQHAYAETKPTTNEKCNHARWRCRCLKWTEYTQGWCANCKTENPFEAWQTEYSRVKKAEDAKITEARKENEKAVKDFVNNYTDIQPVLTSELFTFKKVTGKQETVTLKDGTLVCSILFKKTGESFDRPVLSLNTSDVKKTQPEGNDTAGVKFVTKREFTKNALAKIKASLEPGVDYDVIFELEFEGSCIWTCSNEYSRLS